MNDSDFALLDLVPTPLFVLNASSEGDVTYAFFNQAAIEVTKFTPGDYVGVNAAFLYHGEYGEFAYQKHIECYRAAQPCSYVLQLPLNGKLRTIRTRLMPILDDCGLVKHIIGASAEVTAERELNDIRIASRSIEKELQEFIYLAAHDLRSPMKRVQMIADMLREDFKDLGDGKLEFIGMLEKISIESMSMIQTVLSHAQTDSIEPTIEEIGLLDLTGRILTTLDPIKFHSARVDDCSIYGDRALIQIVLQNLIDNAFKHNASRSVLIDVTAQNAKSGYFTMTITDNGCGMPMPEKLFKGSGTDRSKSGFGLLAIRKLIKKSGGDIVADQPNEGTGLTVTVTLPGTVT